MSIHYRFGGSTADRTIACPSWHNLADEMPSGKVSMAALEGTLMHLMFEAGVENPEFEPAVMHGESRMIEGQMLVVSDTHVEKVYTALDCLDDIVEEYEYEAVYPEVVMNTDDDTGGTADIIAWTAHEKKYALNFGVWDLKTGDGKMVWAKGNPQLLFYAWQAVEKYKGELKFDEMTTFQLGIIQPSDRRDDPVDVWETDLKAIMAFARTYKRAQKEAKAGSKEPCPGSHCKYCPAAPTCPAKTGQIQQAMRLPKDSKNLEDLQWAMTVVDEAEAWCRAVRKLAHEQAEQGVKLTGFKLVAKRAVRQWKDPVAARQRFVSSPKFKAEDYLKQEMKSAPQMEKVCKAKGVDFDQYASMIHLQSSGTTLVKDTDKRPEALPVGALGDMAKRLL